MVAVPLGRSLETGYVVGLSNTSDVPAARLKPLKQLVDPLPAFDEEQLGFFRWIAGYYLSPLGMVIHTALPSQVRMKSVRTLLPTDEGVEALTAGQLRDGDLLVMREVIARPGLTQRGLARKLDKELAASQVKKHADRLVKAGCAQWVDKEIGGLQAKVATVTLALPLPEAMVKTPANGTRMRAIISALAAAGGTLDVAEIAAAQGASSRSTLKRMEELGLVERGEREDRKALEDVQPQGAAEPPALNEHQQAALAELTAPDAEGTFLLFGVTGSGKTEVFLGAAKAALDAGKQVCVLVPEIGLTPQLVGRFKARFGDGIAVLHSGLTARDRLAHWRRIRAGEARVAVGARSALFAPFSDLGLIVVDEEHDDSYKQDDGVPYHARDLAVVLGRRKGAVVVLASATPSMESFHNATEGRYGMLRLPVRATPRPVPSVELIDMTKVDKGPDGGRPMFAPEVVGALRQTFARGGQAVVLYNRRGFATLVQCESCGASYECPNCGISMTLHSRSSTMACHYCGLKRPFSGDCPVCEAPEMQQMGKGTEKVEQVLTALFPDVSMVRMDADTTAVRGAHHRLLERFRNKEAQLLVGTQIVAKGHDFPDVHTAVVVSADQGFRMPDFRASERTFALLKQLAGRAGRGDVPGRVLVQTYKPDHYALDALGSVPEFLAKESRIRQMMRYPPHTRLVLLRLDGGDRRKVVGEASALARKLRDLTREHPGVQVLGPTAAALPRLVGRWRFQIILRGGDVRGLRAFLARAGRIWGAEPMRGVRMTVDVDPRHLM